MRSRAAVRLDVLAVFLLWFAAAGLVVCAWWIRCPPRRLIKPLVVGGAFVAAMAFPLVRTYQLAQLNVSAPAKKSLVSAPSERLSAGASAALVLGEAGVEKHRG